MYFPLFYNLDSELMNALGFTDDYKYLRFISGCSFDITEDFVWNHREKIFKKTLLDNENGKVLREIVLFGRLIYYLDIGVEEEPKGKLCRYFIDNVCYKNIPTKRTQIGSMYHFICQQHRSCSKKGNKKCSKNECKMNDEYIREVKDYRLGEIISMLDSRMCLRCNFINMKYIKPQCDPKFVDDIERLEHYTLDNRIKYIYNKPKKSKNMNMCLKIINIFRFDKPNLKLIKKYHKYIKFSDEMLFFNSNVYKSIPGYHKHVIYNLFPDIIVSLIKQYL